MTEPLPETNLAAYMALVMVVGAANADADPTQRAMLRERVLPPLRDERLTGQEARRASVDALLDIMGADWSPTGEYARVLESLLAPRLDEGPRR